MPENINDAVDRDALQRTWFFKRGIPAERF